jgi:branched-chain amino acid transport system substrate-binding protein
LKKIFIVLSCALIFGCSKSDDTVKIGFIGPLSGAYAVFGEDCRRGSELAVAEINAAGGVLGKQIKLITEDDEGNPEKTMNSYRLLTTRDKLNMIIGSLTSGCTNSISKLAQNQKVLLMAPAATDPKVTDAGNFVFRACFTDQFQGRVGALFAARDLGVKNVSIIFDNGNDYSVGLKDNFIKTFTEEGGKIADTESYITDDKDFNAQVTKIKNAKADAVYIPDYYGTVSLIARQLRAQGVDVPLIGADGWDGLTTNAGDEVLNGFYSNHYSPDSGESKVTAFVKNYSDKYNSVPTSFAALGYDSVYLLRDAVEKVGSTDNSTAVRDALAATDGDYLTGHYTFDEHNNPVKKAVILEIIKTDSGKLATQFKANVEG